MIPPVADTDDPTSQIPWPAARSRLQHDAAVDEGTSIASTSDGGPVDGKSASSPAGRPRLSTWNLITLSIAMGGAQMAWTVELGWESA
jgi:solute carrier family 45 protein 1/2/4